MKINLAQINSNDFRVLSNEIGFLILPQHNKHVWKLDELHLRSLLVDKDGEVVSTGFGKFFNYGEVDEIDTLFQKRFTEGRVTFTEKLDGSLIIVDKYGTFDIRFRTRGNWQLGDFETPIAKLLISKYPYLMPYMFSDFLPLEGMTGVEVSRYSYLFEYIGPENQIILSYTEPDLIFLGMVDKQTLKIVTDQQIIKSVSKKIGMKVPSVFHITSSLQAALMQIRQWKNREGVVACFHDDNGDLQLLKIKSEQYLKMHAIKFSMSDRKAQQLAYIVGIQTEADIIPMLAFYGIDYEMAQYVMPAIRNYLYKEAGALKCFTHLQNQIEIWKKEPTLTRKDFVFRLKLELEHFPHYFSEPTWFNIGVSIYDEKVEAAKFGMYGIVLGESTAFVKALYQNRDKTVSELLTVTAEDDS